MGVGSYLGYIGGALAVVSGAVSVITQKPLITHLLAYRSSRVVFCW